MMSIRTEPLKKKSSALGQRSSGEVPIVTLGRGLSRQRCTTPSSGNGFPSKAGYRWMKSFIAVTINKGCDKANVESLAVPRLIESVVRRLPA